MMCAMKCAKLKTKISSKMNRTLTIFRSNTTEKWI